MTKETYVIEILDFAISNEMDSIQFYTDLSKTADKSYMKELFEQFAGEEKGHKKKLESVKKDRLLVPAAEKIMDLKISDYLIDIEPHPEMTYQEALIIAMKREKAAFKLYTNLSASVTDENVKHLFLFLYQMNNLFQVDIYLNHNHPKAIEPS